MQPHERLKEANFARWCQLAAGSDQFCAECGWPLDPLPPGMKPYINMCMVCESLRAVIATHVYWQKLDKQDAERRKEMGLDDGAAA